MISTKNPKYRQVIEDKQARQFFMKLIGFEITKITEGRIEGRLKVEQKHEQQNGFVHGGVISTIADIVTGLAAFTLIPENMHVVTAEIKISYFRPGICDELIAKGWVEKAGSRFSFCEAEIYAIKDGKETVIAKATTTMAVIAMSNEQ
ncbi:MAG: PaaI family thioesterase [Bacteroidetes bacterium]|nr:PaaI family thioesterase [Bacteroidota bacterium]